MHFISAISMRRGDSWRGCIPPTSQEETTSALCLGTLRNHALDTHSGPISLNPTYNQCNIPQQDDSSCFYSDSACATSGDGGNTTNLKSNEKARDNSSAFITAENGLHTLNGMDDGVSYSKYNFLKTGEKLTPNPPSCRSLDSDSASSFTNEGTKNPSGITHSLTSPDIHASVAAQNGGALWYPMHIRTRKKRKPFSKLQLNELEGEFILNDFITKEGIV